jgi:hypothetical protein
MIASIRHRLVLAIYLCSRGFAFVLFEGSLSPYDWGVQEVRGPQKHAHCLHHIEKIFVTYEPDVLVTQDMTSGGTRRADRIQRLNLSIGEAAETRGIPTYAYSHRHVRQCFASQPLMTKQAIAEAIAKHIPAFEPYLPPPRKLWFGEHSRMPIFDAAALALTHFQTHGQEMPRL